MYGRLNLEEILNYIFETVCGMLLAHSFGIGPYVSIPSIDSSGIGAMWKAKGAYLKVR